MNSMNSWICNLLDGEVYKSIFIIGRVDDFEMDSFIIGFHSGNEDIYFI